MKYFVMALLCFGISINMHAQVRGFNETALIQPFHLEITLHKTSILIFPAPIKTADRGDAYVLAERIKGAENVLKVKASIKNFEPSNIQVITSDGKAYSFNVFYSDNPAQLTVDLRKQIPYAPITFEGLSLNDKELEFYAEVVSVINPFLQTGRFSRYGVEFYLQGIHVKNDVLFLSYQLKNHKGIKYNEASLRFFIRDKKKSKRTAIQDNEQTALHILYKGKPEDPQGQTIIAVFPKFTIAEDKYFTAELTEANGDRNPKSELGQSVLFKSRILR